MRKRFDTPGKQRVDDVETDWGPMLFAVAVGVHETLLNDRMHNVLPFYTLHLASSTP